MDSLIFVTGGTGFIGSSLRVNLHSGGRRTKCLVRDVNRTSNSNPSDMVIVGDINSCIDWSADLVGVDCVVHCAARAHVMRETEPDALVAYRAVNLEGTRRLAEQAAAVSYPPRTTPGQECCLDVGVQVTKTIGATEGEE